MCPFTFHPFPTSFPSGNPPSTLLIYVCVCLIVFYLPHMSEIIWYLGFSIWIILLSKIPSRSIHVVTNVTISSFLWLSSIPLHIYKTSSLSIHLLMSTWVASKFWLFIIFLLGKINVQIWAISNGTEVSYFREDTIYHPSKSINQK